MNIRTGLIASGSGTDADSVMTAYGQKRLHPACQIIGLVSTVADAECLAKAQGHSVKNQTITRTGRRLEVFQTEMADYIRTVWQARLVFLLGCIHTVPMVEGVSFINIHPAHTRRHGGKGMYGLETHKSVLAEIVLDVRRGWKKPGDRFFTFPTIHEVTKEYDQGQPCMTVQVEIPARIIQSALDNPDNLEPAAKELQQVVLRHEHLMLPAAVNMMVQRIIDLG